MANHDDEICVALTRIALAGDGVILGLGMACLAVKTWLKYRSHEQALHAVKDTPLSQIADLHTLVEQDNQAFNISNDYPSSVRMTETLASKWQGGFGFRPWQGFGKKLYLMKPEQLVIVTGRIETKALVEPAESNQELGGLLPHTQKQEQCTWKEYKHVYTMNGEAYLGGAMSGGAFWDGPPLRSKFVVARQVVTFVLAENNDKCSPEGSVPYVHINLEDLKHPIPLLTVHHQFHPVPSSSYTLLQAMFGHRHPVGLLEEERILPVGKEITALGILNRIPNGKPVIKPCSRLPIFLCVYLPVRYLFMLDKMPQQACSVMPCFRTERTHDQLVMELASGTNLLFWLGIVTTRISAGVLGYAIAKNWVRWKQCHQQQLDEENRQNRLLEEETENVADIPEGELCVVCLLRQRQAAFIYCGHRVCCLSCAQRVEHGADPRCPVCRQIVTSTVRVFDS